MKHKHTQSRSQRRYGTSYRVKKIQIGQSRHHRQPRSKGGGNQDENISVVDSTQHQAWHILFSNLHPNTIADIINQKWIDPKYRFVCERLEE